MSMIGMLRGPALVRMSKPSGIAEMVVPVIVTAGMSTDASIGTTSDIEIPSMTEAGISTGMRIGIDSLNEIASRGWARSQGHTDPSHHDWLKMNWSELARDRTKNGQA